MTCRRTPCPAQKLPEDDGESFFFKICVTSAVGGTRIYSKKETVSRLNHNETLMKYLSGPGLVRSRTEVDTNFGLNMWTV